MTKERMFYIAYALCNYMKEREMQNQYEDYEFCMYVSDLANDIGYAAKTNDGSKLECYYKVLYEELEELNGIEQYVKEIEELIGLLDEWKK